MIIRFLIFVFCILSCSSCHRKRVLPVMTEFETKNMDDAFRLRGKCVTSMDSLLRGKDKSANVVFLFNFYDCGSCIDSGFQLVKRMDELYERKFVPIISSMGSPALYQSRNQYFEYIYSDNNDLIRKELKYVQTPVFLRLDSNRVILDYFFPNISDEEEYVRFFSPLGL